MKQKLVPALAVVLTVAFLILVFRPSVYSESIDSRRVAAIIGRARGRLRVARGCSVLSPGIFDGEERYERAIGTVHEVRRDGGLALFDTPIGKLWYREKAWTLPALVQEVQSDMYHMRSGMVKPGDIVFDLGANVGTDTRTALASGAKLVVAVEPEPVTLGILRRNLAQEIADGRVIVVPKGAWNKEDTLVLHVDESDAGGSSFFFVKGEHTVSVPLTTIDNMVRELHLPRVDLIKMDIEGAEKNAILGAADTIKRYHPRLSIELEHNVDDVDVLPATARQLWPGYQVSLTPCTKTLDMIHPQVALVTPGAAGL